MKSLPHKWSKQELDFLQRNSNKLSTREIATQLSLTYDQTRSMIRKLGLDRSIVEIRRLQSIGGHFSKKSATTEKIKQNET